MDRTPAAACGQCPWHPAAPITVNGHGAAESGSATTGIAKSLAELADINGLQNGVFWLTVTDGQVTHIVEQYPSVAPREPADNRSDATCRRSRPARTTAVVARSDGERSCRPAAPPLTRRSPPVAPFPEPVRQAISREPVDESDWSYET